MQKGKNKKSYKIIGAYDSETTNIISNDIKQAFPILHQLGILTDEIQNITPENVESKTRIYFYRHTEQLYKKFDDLVNATFSFVPVICCHNLSFDMYGLAPWLNKHNVKVLAKSEQKPISFTILKDNEPCLVIWDTLIFSQKSLDYMGAECGYPKLLGDWDYQKIRTPDTPLTKQEKAYASHDIYSLLAWLGYWCRLNSDIEPNLLGYKVVSKTGIVRNRRVNKFSHLKSENLKHNLGQYWHFLNVSQEFKNDDELFTCQASTRGGFTFCARENASRVFDFSEDSNIAIYGYDATSQHPSQMVSHDYPLNFKHEIPENLTRAFKIVASVSLSELLQHYARPFPNAFFGVFKFENLRLKKNTPFAKFGIAPLAYSRCKSYEQDSYLFGENQQQQEFLEHLSQFGYRDNVKNAHFSFGKLESASVAYLYITELEAWIISQAYEYDSVSAINGYLTFTFSRPSDMALVSVMQFYGAKNEFKKARKNYYANKKLSNVQQLKNYSIPDFVIDGMNEHSIDDSIIESTYLNLKADLNALFGIEACNEYRRDTVLSPNDGIKYTGDFGICNKPKNPKAFYEFGQRIVGWSRVAQCVVMLLCFPFIETIINGDTDSIKFVIKDENLSKVNKELEKLSCAIDQAKNKVCAPIRKNYPDQFNELKGIGYYILEFKTKKFCASWNKAYCICEKDPRDGQYHVKFTLAGVPTKKVNLLADKLLHDGWSFGKICDTFLGYNVTYSHDITCLLSRSFPEWGSFFDNEVTDYQGNKSHVHEPCSICLYNMSKTVNDTQNIENAINERYALENRNTVNIEPIIITSDNIINIKDMINNE